MSKSTADWASPLSRAQHAVVTNITITGITVTLKAQAKKGTSQSIKAAPPPMVNCIIRSVAMHSTQTRRPACVRPSLSGYEVVQEEPRKHRVHES